jgi:tetratricopeptide (TPR) repeat protein
MRRFFTGNKHLHKHFITRMARAFHARATYACLLILFVSLSSFSFLKAVEAHSDQNPPPQSQAYPSVPPENQAYPSNAQSPAYSSAPAGPLPAVEDKQRQAYADKVADSYNFAFGKEKISFPGNAAVEGNTFLQPESFFPATYCERCHQEAYHQWRQSLHSNAFRTPFYRTSVNILINTKGIEFARHCDSCHNPVAVLGGGLTRNSIVNRKFDQDGLTCSTCHSVQKLQSTLGNGGFVMGVPSVLVDEKGVRLPGMQPDSEILAHLDRHSKAVMQSFYRTPEFCSACHKANLPRPLNDYKWIRAFTAYDEWQNSKFSQRNPLTFYTADFKTCQRCHMQRSPNTLPEPGAKNGTFASHRWAAGNTAVPFYYGFDEQLAKTVEFLKSGNYLNVDLFAIRKNNESVMVAPLGSVPFSLTAGDTIQTMVVIQNKNIGHSLIPEVRDLYEAWVEFVVTDSAGKEVYHSGFIKPDGMLDQSAHSFTNRPVNTDGVFVDNHKVWTIHSVAYDNSVQAGRSTLVRYEFKVPQNAKGALTITARVNYRHLRQSYLNNVFGKDHPAYPIVELASRTRSLTIGENAASAPDPHDNPDWMRWNNLGIAYLDQLQFADSIHAFSQVVQLRPDYADGYTNIGLTEIEWEKYDSARSALEKALALSPDNIRATYYLALVERRAGHSDAEIADLQKVVAAFPQSRDGRRELGVSYYQQHRQKEAMEQFEALQTIDPDDLTAHYNLALLYRRMGMKDKAKEQSEMFATKKLDPGAPTYSLNFLRKHPEISTESIPWHVHTNLPHSPASGSDQPGTP